MTSGLFIAILICVLSALLKNLKAQEFMKSNLSLSFAFSEKSSFVLIHLSQEVPVPGHLLAWSGSYTL